MTMEALAAAVEARDAYTHGHTERVASYARVLAQALGLQPPELETLQRACTFEHAKGEILQGSATHFDPEVVTAFIKSQQAIEELLDESVEEEGHPHPEPGDLQGWRLHVVGR